MTEDELQHPEDLSEALISIAVLVERIKNRDAAQAELLEWRRGVDDQLTVLKTRREGNLAMIANVVGFVALVLAAWAAFKS